MWFESVIGYRKLLMGVCMAGVGIKCDPSHMNLLLGIYLCFCIGNMVEHLSEVFLPADKAIDAVAHPAPEHLSKIIAYQETQLKALDFIVTFIKESQRVRPPS